MHFSALCFSRWGGNKLSPNPRGQPSMGFDVLTFAAAQLAEPRSGSTSSVFFFWIHPLVREILILDAKHVQNNVIFLEAANR